MEDQSLAPLFAPTDQVAAESAPPPPFKPLSPEQRRHIAQLLSSSRDFYSFQQRLEHVAEPIRGITRNVATAFYLAWLLRHGCELRAVPDEIKKLLEVLPQIEHIAVESWYSDGQHWFRVIDGHGKTHQRAVSFTQKIADVFSVFCPLLNDVTVPQVAAVEQAALSDTLEGLLDEAIEADKILELSSLQALFSSITGAAAPLPLQYVPPTISPFASEPVEMLASALATAGTLPQETEKSDPQEPAIDDKGDSKSPPGWDFNAGRTAFRGIEITVKGQARRALQRLAGAKYGVTSRTLETSLAYDKETPLDRATVRWHIGNVRHALRLAFDTANKDPVPLLDRGENLSWKIDESLLTPRQSAFSPHRLPSV